MYYSFFSPEHGYHPIPATNRMNQITVKNLVIVFHNAYGFAIVSPWHPVLSAPCYFFLTNSMNSTGCFPGAAAAIQYSILTSIIDE